MKNRRIINFLYSVAGMVILLIPGFSEDLASSATAEAGEPTPVPHQLRYPRALAKIESQTRSFDPFGLNMDTERKGQMQMEPIPVAVEPVKEPDTVSLLQDALKKLSITGIMPGRQAILLGGRFLQAGQNLEIRHEEILFRLRLDQVQSGQLVFTDVETNETVNHPVNIFPRGREGLEKYRSGLVGLPSGSQPMTNRILIE